MKKVLVAIKVKDQQGKDEMRLVMRDKTIPCKTCNKKDRRQGSACCGECSLKFHSGL